MGGKPRKKPAPPPFEPVEQALHESSLWITVGVPALRAFARRVAELTLLEAAKIAEDDYTDGAGADVVADELLDLAEELK